MDRLDLYMLLAAIGFMTPLILGTWGFGVVERAYNRYAWRKIHRKWPSKHD